MKVRDYQGTEPDKACSLESPILVVCDEILKHQGEFGKLTSTNTHVDHAKVTVIVPAKNEEKNMGLLLDSLINQSHIADEIVVADDGSADATAAIVRKYSEKFPVKLVNVHQPSSPGKARNVAIKASNADILAFMDGSMVADRNWLKNLLAPLLIDPQLDITFGNVIYDTKSRIRPISDFQKGLVFWAYPPEHSVRCNIPASAIRKQSFEKIGYFKEIKRSEDLFFFDLIDKLNFKYEYVRKGIAYYFEYPQTYKEVFQKWRFSVKINTQHQISGRGFFRQLFMKGAFLVALLIVVALLARDLRWALLFLVLIALRFIPRIYLHKKLSIYFLKRPHLWPQLFCLFVTLETARFCGFVTGLWEILKSVKKRRKLRQF